MTTAASTGKAAFRATPMQMEMTKVISASPLCNSKHLKVLGNLYAVQSRYHARMYRQSQKGVEPMKGGGPSVEEKAKNGPKAPPQVVEGGHVEKTPSGGEGWTVVGKRGNPRAPRSKPIDIPTRRAPVPKASWDLAQVLVELGWLESHKTLVNPKNTTQPKHMTEKAMNSIRNAVGWRIRRVRRIIHEVLEGAMKVECLRRVMVLDNNFRGIKAKSLTDSQRKALKPAFDITNPSEWPEIEGKGGEPGVAATTLAPEASLPQVEKVAPPTPVARRPRRPAAKSNPGVAKNAAPKAGCQEAPVAPTEKVATLNIGDETVELYAKLPLGIQMLVDDNGELISEQDLDEAVGEGKFSQLKRLSKAIIEKDFRKVAHTSKEVELAKRFTRRLIPKRLCVAVDGTKVVVDGWDLVNPVVGPVVCLMGRQDVLESAWWAQRVLLSSKSLLSAQARAKSQPGPLNA